MVTLIIVDYKTIERTMQYLTEWESKCRFEKDLHVIIVDNSENGFTNLDILEKLSGHVLTPCNSAVMGKKIYKGSIDNQSYLYVAAWENLGYAKGNNLGAKVAQEYFREDSFYLFSNNDLRLPDEFRLNKLIEPFEKNEDIAAAGPKIVGTDGKAQTPWKKINSGKQLFFSYIDLLLPKFCKISKYITNLDIQEPDYSRDVYWVTGAFILVDAEVFNQVDGFDENTFLYCEEMILAERIQRVGKKMYYEMQVSVVHEHGKTVEKIWKVLEGITFSFESCLYYYREYRGMSYITEKLARINFCFFKKLFTLKKKLKGE